MTWRLETKTRFGVKILCLLLAGIILAVCSSCAGKQSESGSASAGPAVLPTVGVNESGETPAETSGEDGTEAESETEQQASKEETVAVSSEETETTKEARTPVRTLSADEIEAIRAAFDGKVYGFGTGFRHEYVDANNRPAMVNNLLAHFAGSDANIRMYCSGADEKCVAFSFQCGTEYGHTAAVLDILAKYEIESTFYIIHSYAERNRALVERMLADGHVIGSHTYSCPPDGIARHPLEEQMEDAMKMQQYMQASYGYTMSKYNFNSGYWSEQAVIMMSRMGYQVDFCSCNYSDYDPAAIFDAEALLSDLEQSLHPGCIYCFHTTNVITPTILEPLIRYCLAQGYRIVQVP